ncbi:hypothetical protein BVI434_500053 [Burkholderia vietnamiensis]|nr:hypothetical protein BVI434_500053 [Burkholderia vietnamiensis]
MMGVMMRISSELRTGGGCGRVDPEAAGNRLHERCRPKNSLRRHRETLYLKCSLTNRV